MSYTDDNEEKGLTWEQQALAYQDALETALMYQRDLEQKIESLREAIKSSAIKLSEERRQVLMLRQNIGRREETIRQHQDQMSALKREQEEALCIQEQRHEARVQVLNRTIEEQAEQIKQLQQLLTIQQKLLRIEREPGSGQ